ncbi:MAG: EF-P lysine aminoacylase EpmA [Gammaproteobacteria bacterium]|nr:EF-P lysine aminoacylase EpmA [Gammaproteobacteria bacterium]
MTDTNPVLSVAERLQYRASLYAAIRTFFSERKVTEVETPIFSAYANTDPFIQSLPAHFPGQLKYAHTSPEFAMKRLLCQGSGDIYQICKVFRLEEEGRLHQQEFSMLEWYRLGVGYRQLAGEVLELLNTLGLGGRTEHYTYQQLFRKFLNIDVLDTDVSNLRQTARSCGINDIDLGEDFDGWLHLLLTHVIEPQIKNIPLLAIYDFPASQAALAKLSENDRRVALRFEIYVKGIELANGYQELTESVVYRQRFEKENDWRKRHQMALMPIDEALLQDLESGLPECAGVALGLDRLLMLHQNCDSLQQVLVNSDVKERL